MTSIFGGRLGGDAGKAKVAAAYLEDGRNRCLNGRRGDYRLSGDLRDIGALILPR